MKKALTRLLCAVMLLSQLTPAALAAEPSYAGKTVLLYTGNVRGDLSVYPQVQAVKERYETAGAEVVLADTGNFLQGSAQSNETRGLSVYEAMDAAGYDVAAMGLAEFSYADATTGYLYHGNYTKYYTQAMLQQGTPELTYNQNRDGSVTATLPAKEAATFQTLSANAEGKDCYAFVPSTVITTPAGLKLAFYALTDPDVGETVQDGYVSVSQPAVPEGLDEAGDFVVCLSNAALPVGDFGDISIVTDPQDGLTAGAYVIDRASGAVSLEAVSLTGEAWSGDGCVGVSQVVLNGSDQVNWNGESNLGDLTADALVWYAKNYMDGLDSSLPVVAIQNGGNCDNFLYTGEITETDLLRALPFSPMGIGVLYVTGAELLETLEAAAQQADCPGFAQVSGLTYLVNGDADYDAGAAYGSYYEADSIQRVTITSVGGQDFDPNARYALVCDNFLLNGNDTYYTLKACKEADGAVYLNNGNGVKVRDAVALYIQNALGGVIGPEYAAPQGRITVQHAPFADVPLEQYYAEPVSWAVEQGITGGTGDNTFSPLLPCTRGQIVTFLWRAAASPAPADSQTDFADISPEDYYYNAVLWAVEQGITSGISDTAFGPNGVCTRGQALTFLWKAVGSPVPASEENAFADVADTDYFRTPVLWAAAEGVTAGTGTDTFSPNAGCTRAEIVTFLYSVMGMVEQ